jgi:hypothetical protein
MECHGLDAELRLSTGFKACALQIDAATSCSSEST